MRDNSDMELIRERGITALKTVLKKDQNIRIIESNIFALSTESSYIFNLYEYIKDIHSGVKLSEILSNIKNKKLNWKHNSFKNMIFEEEEQDDFIIKPFEVEDGVLECHCGSKRVYSYSKQTRGSDEPTSTFATCMACGKKWTYSG